MKFALLSHSLPPSLSGQAMMLYRLLKGLDPSNYCLISRENYDADEYKNSYTPKLPGKYYCLSEPFQIRRGYRFGIAKVRESANFLIAITWRIIQLVKILRRERCDVVIACTGDLLDLPAAYMASKLAGAKFYPYIFDYYSYQWTEPKERMVAQRLEPILMRGATDIISPNEFMSEELKRRYEVKSSLLRNPCDISEYETSSNGTLRENDGEIRIVYTGVVSEAHFDAFKRLMAALQRGHFENVKVHIFTSRSASSLAENGITGPLVCHQPQPLSMMPAIQRSADILFLPLAFNSPYPEVIKTSATSKLGEYLASKRPILVHAPADSFIAWYLRKHDCGLVVDREDTEALARAIENILGNTELQQRLSTNAWERARSEFATKSVQAKFSELMHLRPQAWT